MGRLKPPAARLQAFDSLAVAAVVAELRPLLCGARISKIAQPSDRELLITLRTRGQGNLDLLISTAGTLSRFHLTSKRFPTSGPPKAFCLALRKHLTGLPLLDLWQIGLDRAVVLEFGYTDLPAAIFAAGPRRRLDSVAAEGHAPGAPGPATGRAERRPDAQDAWSLNPAVANDLMGYPGRTRRRLIAELSGTHSNCLLLDETQRVIAVLRPVSERMSTIRQLLPGMMYQPPPIDVERADPLTASVRSALIGERTLVQALLAHFHSLSRVAISQIITCAGLAPERVCDTLSPTEREALELAWTAAMDNVVAGRLRPWFQPVAADGGQDPSIGTWTVISPSTSRQEFTAPLDSFQVALAASAPTGEGAFQAHLPARERLPPTRIPANAFFDRYYGEQSELLALERLRSSVVASIKRQLAKLDAQFGAANEAIASARRGSEYKLWADLLLTHRANVRPGAAAVHLRDFHGDEVVIPLDERLNCSANAQRYYRYYRKAQGTLAAATVRVEVIEEERHSRQELLRRAISCEDPTDLAAIAEELDPGTESLAGTRETGAVARYRSPDGLEILVGRNPRQNDYITTRLARSTDWWFHAQRAPGAHVLVRSVGAARLLPERTLYQAALLAAWFSRARHDTKVPVAYTLRKYVRRPPGSKPGFVVYDHERVLLVTIDRSEIAAIAPS